MPLENAMQALIGQSYDSFLLTIVSTTTVISGRLPAGNVLIFPQTVVGAGYRKARVM